MYVERDSLYCQDHRRKEEAFPKQSPVFPKQSFHMLKQTRKLCAEVLAEVNLWYNLIWVFTGPTQRPKYEHTLWLIFDQLSFSMLLWNKLQGFQGDTHSTKTLGIVDWRKIYGAWRFTWEACLCLPCTSLQPDDKDAWFKECALPDEERLHCNLIWFCRAKVGSSRFHHFWRFLVADLGEESWKKYSKQI